MAAILRHRDGTATVEDGEIIVWTREGESRCRAVEVDLELRNGCLTITRAGRPWQVLRDPRGPWEFFDEYELAAGRRRRSPNKPAPGLLVRFEGGTVTIAGAEVVVRRETRVLGITLWEREDRCLIAEASAAAPGPGTRLDIYRAGELWQTVEGIEVPHQAREFAAALEEARAAATAVCRSCGTPRQPIGRECGHCGALVER